MHILIHTPLRLYLAGFVKNHPLFYSVQLTLYCPLFYSVQLTLYWRKVNASPHRTPKINSLRNVYVGYITTFSDLIVCTCSCQRHLVISLIFCFFVVFSLVLTNYSGSNFPKYNEQNLPWKTLNYWHQNCLRLALDTK